MDAVAVIAGSGAEDLKPFADWSPVRVETPYGETEIRRGELYGRKVIFAPRHGARHSIPPHQINYRGIVSALQLEDVRCVIGTAAVGSLSSDMRPGTAGVVTDFIDFTRRGSTTFYDGDDGEVVHTDMSAPFCPDVAQALLSGSEMAELEVTTPCTYVCVDGPRYETPAEISMFRSWGGDVIGMTTVPEAILCREVGICYGSIAVVTNYASGISPTPLSHAEVIEVMQSVEQRITSAVALTVQLLPATRACSCNEGDAPSV